MTAKPRAAVGRYRIFIAVAKQSGAPAAAPHIWPYPHRTVAEAMPGYLPHAETASKRVAG